MQAILNKTDIFNTTNYKFKGIEYIVGELDLDMARHTKSEYHQLLKPYTNRVIVFNDYFSSNEIKGDTFTYMDDLCFEIKPIYNFWETSINLSFFADFIVLPDNLEFNELTKNTIIELIISYISNKLKTNHEPDSITDYITKLSNTQLLLCKVDMFDFTKPIIIKLDSGIIEQLVEENDIDQDIEESDDSYEDEMNECSEDDMIEE